MIVATRPEDLRGRAGPLALSVGVFDGVHRGHRAVLDLLREEGRADGAFSLAVTLDPHPLAVLRPADAPLLLSTPSERLHLLEDAGVDAAWVFPFRRETAALTAEEFLDAITPPPSRLVALVVGHDFRMGRDRSGGFEELKSLGEARSFRVVRAGPTLADGEPVSSTRIRTLVREGRVREAAALLAHPYLLEGNVVPGRGVGRTLDFPTANVDVKDGRKLLPLGGVYAVRVEGAKGPGDVLPGVLNLGVRPTFDLTETTIEVHLPGFSGNLTGRRLRIEFVDRIREERRFPGPEALKARIAEDVREARRILEAAL